MFNIDQSAAVTTPTLIQLHSFLLRTPQPHLLSLPPLALVSSRRSFPSVLYALMNRSKYGYLPLFKGSLLTYPQNRQQWLCIACAFLSLFNSYFIATTWIWPPDPSSLIDDYQRLKPNISVGRLDLIQPQLADQHEHAIVSSMYTDAFAYPVATLGLSLTLTNTSARKILMYLPDKVSAQALCIARSGGWEVHPVPFIAPPHQGSGTGYRFGDQYTKLNLWGLEALGVKAAVYLDADTLARKSFDELFALPYDFAAVPDVFVDNRHGGFKLGFNAGVLFLRPDNATFTHMLHNLERAVFPPLEAEQAFLNIYFAAETVRLPYVYNGNLAIKLRNPDMWTAMRNDLRVVHYTSVKPVDVFSGVQTRENIKKGLNRRKEKKGGKLKEEIGWWENVWMELLEEPGLDECFEGNHW